MKTIWKFPFHVSDSVAIEMPKGAVILPNVEAGPRRAAHPDRPTGSPELWTEVEELVAALAGRDR